MIGWVVIDGHGCSWLYLRQIDLVDDHFCFGCEIVSFFRIDKQRQFYLGLVVVEIAGRLDRRNLSSRFRAGVTNLALLITRPPELPQTDSDDHKWQENHEQQWNPADSELFWELIWILWWNLGRHLSNGVHTEKVYTLRPDLPINA